MSNSDTPIRLLRKPVKQKIHVILNQGGMTIDSIEAQKNKKYTGDAIQEAYRSKPVWHTRQSMISSVATKLKIPQSLHGPNRVSNDFHELVDQEITSLRSKKLVVNWSTKKNIGVFRLVAKPDPSIIDQEMNLEGVIPTSTMKPATIDISEENMKQKFISILTKGKRDNTYKFALAKALLEFCRDNTSTTNYDIPYEYLSNKFLEYYWYQECKFRMKQNFKVDKPPRVVTIIRNVFGKNFPGSFRQLKSEDKEIAQKQILKNVFGHARKNTSQVVPRFQKIATGNSSERLKIFYKHNDDTQIIHLRPEAFRFFKKNYRLLSMAVLSEWAKYLERVNQSLPRLVAKIEHDNIKRGILTPYKKLYLEHTNHCFYCASKLEPRYIHVDHFIPWSYIFDDNAWNLVLACQECNCRKNNALPQEEFRNSLIKRNLQYSTQIRRLQRSLELLDTGKGWEPEIENHYTNCQAYGFNVIHLP